MPLHHSVGKTVVLKEGQGEKRKFNGLKATIATYPAEGDLMTVFVQSKKVRWSKADCVPPLPDLEGHLWTHVFRFLGSPDAMPEEEESVNVNDAEKEEELLWVRDAVKVHTQLASVCHAWRGICHQNLPTIFGRLNANFDALATEKIVPIIQWLCKHNLKIGVLKFDTQLEELPLLEELLTKCDMRNLINVRAYINKSLHQWSRSWQWTSMAYDAQNPSAQIPSEGIIDLTGDVGTSFETKARALNVPIRDMSQKEFHNVLAKQCPSLATLSLSVTMPVGEERFPCSEYLSATLFSMPSITKLDVLLVGDHRGAWGGSVNGMVFNKMIQNLSGLTSLAIHANRELYGNKFLIMSPTLKTLDVTGLSKGVWVAVDCPKLERFESGSGDGYSGGTLPLYRNADVDDFDSFTESFSRAEGLVVPAGRVPMMNLSVPDTCECILRRVYEPFSGHSELMELCRDARFEIW